MLTRRDFAGALPIILGSGSLSACSTSDGSKSYAAASEGTWRHGSLQGLAGAALSEELSEEMSEELVRYATLAPSSHNTQCWKFAIEGDAITILPDFARRCPAVDPDDHHVFVSLGCAAENLMLAARAHGLRGEPSFDQARGAVRIALASAPADTTPLFKAIPSRQCTRAEYDGEPLSVDELKQLEAAGSSARVRMLLLTEKPALEKVLEFVVQGNSAQMRDKAFVEELKVWIRFSEGDAARLRDGLFARSSGNPTLPAWLGGLMFNLVFTEKSENDKYAKHLRSSAGIAVFFGAQADKAHWVEVGRAYERFALQATALSIRNAHVNMPIEVATLRPQFAAALGLGTVRPDLVIRFGRGPLLPPSLRRPVRDVIVPS
jgi:hypothetical protein